jgi:hypothetical protein
VWDDTFEGIDGRGGAGRLESARYDSRKPVVDFDLNSLFMLRFHTEVFGFRVSEGASLGEVTVSTGLARVGDMG